MNNSIPKVKRTFYSVVIKRLLDILLSGLALLVLSPVLALICILELVFHGKPIIYCTKRPGKDGKIFNMYKFRSMTNVAAGREKINKVWLFYQKNFYR